jgi:hypothetical protein
MRSGGARTDPVAPATPSRVSRRDYSSTPVPRSSYWRLKSPPSFRTTFSV